MFINKKNLTVTALSLVFSVCCAVALSGCGHQHSGSRMEDIPATCTESGMHTIYCEECGEIRFQDVIPAKGHRYSDYSHGYEVTSDYCFNCGEPNPDSSAFVSSENFGTAQLTEDGVLSWGRLREAVKYEISLTFSGADGEQIFTVEKTKSSVNLEELTGETFPTGKTSVTFTPYAVHKETVDGEKIEQEYPLSELSDEFNVIKLNGKFSVTRLGFADENVTMNGFYSDAREDEYGNSYYLLEQLLKDNKATQFNISSRIKAASGVSLKYYRTEEDRAERQNALSSMDLQFQYINAGYNTFYMQATGNGMTRDYNLKVYGLQTLTVSFYDTVSSTVDGYRKDTYTKIGSEITYIEGDIIPKELLFANCKYDVKAARDGDYNIISSDYVVKTPTTGSDLKIYFSETVSQDCRDYEDASTDFTLTETEQGWILSNRYSQSQSSTISVNDKIMGKKVLSIQLYYSEIESINIYIEGNLNISIVGCDKLKSIYLGSGITHIEKGAFAGANNECVINCNFTAEYANEHFESGWYAKNPSSIYAGNYTVKYSY